MSRHTVTIMEALESELQNSGLSEFVNFGKITFNDPKFAFMQKVLQYDDDVSEIVDNIIFKGFSFKDKKVDRYFKETFINRFMDREINRQTIEAFATQVLYVTLTHQEYIYNTFSLDYMRYIENHVTFDNEETSNSIAQELQDQNTTNQAKGKSHEDFKGNEVNDTTGESHEDTTGNEDSDSTTNVTTHDDSKAKHREANATLPQSQQNLNLNSDTMSYADSQTNSNDSTVSDGTSETKANSKTDTKGTADGTTKGHSNTDTVHTTDNDNENLSNTVSNSNRSNTDDTKGNQKGITKTYDLDNLNKIFEMKDKIFEEYDKKCFLQIW